MKRRRLVWAVASLVAALTAFQLSSTPSCASGVTLYWPVHGTITTYFSATHPALDISANYGTQVRAAAPGTVVWAGWKNNGGGFVVDVRHAGGVLTSYNHLAEIDVALKQVVSANTIIGKVGMSGHATGPHLHFAVEIGNVWVNPLPLLHNRGVPNTSICGSH